MLRRAYRLTAHRRATDASRMVDPDIRKLLDTVFATPEPPTPDVAALRAAAERAPALLGGEPEPVAEVRDVLAGHAGGAPVPLRLYRPTIERRPVVVFAHGGGWVTGSLDSHDRLCRLLANRLDAVVCAVDYRRAPEHRHPAALDDFDAAWHWCLERSLALGGDGGAPSVAGDSAGGGMAASLSQRLRGRGEALPSMQLLIYPAVDASASSRSYDTYATGHNLSARMMRWYWKCYAPDVPLDDPLLSPLASDDLHGLPPAVVAVATSDVLHDEGILYAQRLASANVPVDVVVCQGMIHGFVRWTGAVPAALHNLERICAAARPRVHGRK
jgi:acetyl esterase